MIVLRRDFILRSTLMLNFDYETSLLLLNTLFLENIVEKLGQGFDLFLVEIENLFHLIHILHSRFTDSLNNTLLITFLKT